MENNGERNRIIIRGAEPRLGEFLFIRPTSTHKTADAGIAWVFRAYFNKVIF